MRTFLITCCLMLVAMTASAQETDTPVDTAELFLAVDVLGVLGAIAEGGRVGDLLDHLGPLLPENREAWLIWEEIQTQVIPAGFSIVGINHGEYRQKCRDLDIIRTRALDLKIQRLERELIKSANAKPDKR